MSNFFSISVLITERRHQSRGGSSREWIVCKICKNKNYLID